MKRRNFTIVLAFVAVGALGVWYYVFQYSKTHHRNVESEHAIIVTTAQIVRDFEASETSANTKYLNKAVQLRGIILKKDKDQVGHATVTIKSGDPMTNIFCTFKTGVSVSQNDSVIVIKGICSGFLSDVVLNDAVVVKSR